MNSSAESKNQPTLLFQTRDQVKRRTPEGKVPVREMNLPHAHHSRCTEQLTALIVERTELEKSLRLHPAVIRDGRSRARKVQTLLARRKLAELSGAGQKGRKLNAADVHDVNVAALKIQINQLRKNARYLSFVSAGTCHAAQALMGLGDQVDGDEKHQGTSNSFDVADRVPENELSELVKLLRKRLKGAVSEGREEGKKFSWNQLSEEARGLLGDASIRSRAREVRKRKEHGGTKV